MDSAVFIHCLFLLPLFVVFSVGSLFCCAVPCVLSSFEIILLGKRELAAILLWYSECPFSVIVLCFFLTVPWSVVCDCGIYW